MDNVNWEAVVKLHKMLTEVEPDLSDIYKDRFVKLINDMDIIYSYDNQGDAIVIPKIFILNYE